MATLTKQPVTQTKIDQAREAAVAALLAAYTPHAVEQPGGAPPLHLCWSGRIARAYDKLAIARIARDTKAIEALQNGVNALTAKYAEAQKAAEDAAAQWAALAAAGGVTVQSMDVYPPTCTCEGCKAAQQYQDKVQWRAVYVNCLYDFIAPTSTDTPPVIELMRRLRDNKSDKEAQDRFWSHMRRISDAGEAYARACADADVRPNWRALWPDEETS